MYVSCGKNCEQNLRIIELLGCGHTYIDVCRMTGSKLGRVRFYAKKLGVKPPRFQKVKPGPSRKLLDKARAMSDLHTAGETMESIGKRFGVTKQRVHQLIACLQSKGQPIAKSLNSRPKQPSLNWAILYDDANRKPELFSDGVTARSILAERRVAWSCYLFRRVAP